MTVRKSLCRLEASNKFHQEEMNPTYVTTAVRVRPLSSSRKAFNIVAHLEDKPEGAEDWDVSEKVSTGGLAKRIDFALALVQGHVVLMLRLYLTRLAGVRHSVNDAYQTVGEPGVDAAERASSPKWRLCAYLMLQSLIKDLLPYRTLAYRKESDCC